MTFSKSYTICPKCSLTEIWNKQPTQAQYSVFFTKIKGRKMQILNMTDAWKNLTLKEIIAQTQSEFLPHVPSSPATKPPLNECPETPRPMFS